MNRRATLLIALALLPAATGCGGGAGGPSLPSVAPAKTYRLSDFSPRTPVEAGRPVDVSFAIAQPSGQRLVRYRTGPGPHTGIHLILVRDDLETIIHRHPKVGADGLVHQRIVFPEPGPYRVLVDVYPATASPQYVNFQLFTTVHVRGIYHPRPLPRFRPTVHAGGYTFTIAHPPKLRLARAAVMTVSVRDAAGRAARFTPWYGALAHAIFFHQGDLAYFHTHVCGAGVSGCTSAVPTGQQSAATPGQLRVGILLPQAGTWRLFLQCQVNGTIVTAPFTLKVAG
jgi:hypothetical protein